MIRLGFSSLLAGALLWAAVPGAQAQSSNAAPEFSEVYDLIRANLPGATEGELSRTAAQALVTALSPRVAFVTESGSNYPASSLADGVTVFEGNMAYLRVHRVEEGLAGEVRRACESTTNKLEGLVLDLRYADGYGYGAAADTADLFIKKAVPLLNWGRGMVQSKAKTNAIALPVAVLVNRQTSAASEALAAALREAGAGLLLGGTTAGAAAVTKDFPLKGGGQLRIATAAIQAGPTTLLSAKGIKPDIAVAVSAEDERAYFADAYKGPSRVAMGGTSTNRTTRRVRFNEAELVRERREGTDIDAAEARPAEPEKPLVRDPVLARALDLLKGLAVVRPMAQ